MKKVSLFILSLLYVRHLRLYRGADFEVAEKEMNAKC